LLLPALVLIAFGGHALFKLLWDVKAGEWLTIVTDLAITLVRVLSAIAISTVIAVPIGVWIGSNPRLSKYLMPVTQIAASFPSRSSSQISTSSSYSSAATCNGAPWC